MQALTDAGQFDEAELQAREILRQDPENAGAYRALSSMYFAKGKLGMAQLCNEKALALNDADPGIYNNMGVTYVLQKDAERAIERFKKAVQIDPGNFEANMNLGFIALDSGDYGLALTSFQAANKTDPSSRDARLGLAVALRGTGDFEAADKLYRAVIKADPKFKEAYFNASIMHERYTRDFKAAEKYLDDFIAAHAGQISPTHEVYNRKKRIQASAEEERKRKEALAAAERERKEREERNKRILEELKGQISKTEARIAQCQDPDTVEMSMMYIEQVKEGLDDASMAGDLKTFVDQVNELLDACLGVEAAE
jgi:Flp pilus assembly protein TadD